MNQIMLCPDLQSPELSQPCPSSHPTLSHGGGVDSTLPLTGADILIMLLVATVIILFAYWLIQGVKEDE